MIQDGQNDGRSLLAKLIAMLRGGNSMVGSGPLGGGMGGGAFPPPPGAFPPPPGQDGSIPDIFPQAPTGGPPTDMSVAGPWGAGIPPVPVPTPSPDPNEAVPRPRPRPSQIQPSQWRIDKGQ
jgi:hypothetical protein